MIDWVIKFSITVCLISIGILAAIVQMQERKITRLEVTIKSASADCVAVNKVLTGIMLVKKIEESGRK